MASLFAVVPSAAMAVPQATPQHRGELVRRIDSVVQAERARSISAGLSVAVEFRGELLMARGYGYANLEHEVPVTVETVFRLGSITEQFTALAVLQLVERGKLRLEDDIREYLPDFPARGYAVTIHHLLAHTSGIKSYAALDRGFRDASRRNPSRGELFALLQNEPFDFEPGEDWARSDLGYLLLEMIVETTSGQSYAEHLQANVFGPLGMTGTTMCHDRAIVPHRAWGYVTEEGQLVHAVPDPLGIRGAAGILCATALDLITWQRALDDGWLLSPRVGSEMVREATLNDGSSTGYVYGRHVKEYEGHRVLEQGGQANGFVGALVSFPEDDLTVVILANAEGTHALRLGSSVARLVLGLPPSSSDVVVEAAAQAGVPSQRNVGPRSDWRERYTGTYLVNGAEVQVFVAGDSLIFNAPGQVVSRLIHGDGDQFTLAASPQMRVKFEMAGSRARGVVVMTGYGTIRGDRVGDAGAPVADVPPGRTAAARPAPADLPVGWQERYSGTYRIRGVVIRVYAAGDALMVDAPGQVESRLIHQDGDEFTQAGAPQTRIQFDVVGSQAQGLVVVTGEGTFRGERVGEPGVTQPARPTTQAPAGGRVAGGLPVG
jgi:CubicO group peptidase (beta-lactamase class C family)